MDNEVEGVVKGVEGVEVIFLPIWEEREALKRINHFKEAVVDIGSSYYIKKIKDKDSKK